MVKAINIRSTKIRSSEMITVCELHLFVSVHLNSGVTLVSLNVLRNIHLIGNPEPGGHLESASTSQDRHPSGVHARLKSNHPWLLLPHFTLYDEWELEVPSQEQY